MNLTKVSAVAEIVSSIAIVLTLIYLAIQSQQTNNALLADSRQATMIADITMSSAVLNNPEIAVNFKLPLSELTEAEQAQVTTAVAGISRVREYAWFQYKNGILEESTLRSYLNPLVRISQMESAAVAWRLHAQELDAEFVNYVEQLRNASE